MKFYGVYYEDDPVDSDILFPTRKAREDYIKKTYEAGDEGVRRREIEVQGRLTKQLVCEVYDRAMR